MTDVNDKLTSFPAFFRVAGRSVAIFGGGDEAYAKARLLAATQARILAFSEDFEPAYVAFLARHGYEAVKAGFAPEQLDDICLAFAATGENERDRAIAGAARARKIPVNAVDQPDACDFLTPAIVSRPPVAIAIGTEGAGPVLAQMIRLRADRLLPPWIGQLAKLAAQCREQAEKRVPKGAARRAFWRGFFSLSGPVARAVEAGDAGGARAQARHLLEAGGVVQGRVFLIGAGPGAEDLLTLRAQRLLMEADAVVFDALVPQAIIDMGRRDAERIDVGKRKGRHSVSQADISRLLVRLAREGRQVVRLKSGDPLIFGRAGEEMAALAEAGIAFEVVPGVTSALAAAADFQLPLTLRGVSSSLIFASGHDISGEAVPEWAPLALSGATIAVYMSRTVLAAMAQRLIAAGLAGETPVGLVENASRQERRLLHGTLANLAALCDSADLEGPVITIIGEAVAGADLSRSEPVPFTRQRVPRHEEVGS